MGKVAIVTDSTSTIPAELINGYPIFTLPLQVIWGEQVLHDGVDISPDEFYARLKTDHRHPTTSQATPAAFRELYLKLLKNDYDILSIHISSKLSGTIDSATKARESISKANIEIVDSNTTSMEMGFHILAAARLAAQGATLQECRSAAEQARSHTHIYFVLSTLEYLRRGGRIGGAAAFMGSVLNLKPILEVHNGHIGAVERVRTMNKALDRLLELVESKVDKEHGPLRLAVLHADTPDEAQALLNRTCERFGPSLVSEALVSRISPVLGVHTGPGALGLTFMSGM